MTKKTAEEKYVAEYRKLCDQHKLQIIVTPRWVMNENKDFVLKIEMGVGALK